MADTYKLQSNFSTDNLNIQIFNSKKNHNRYQDPNQHIILTNLITKNITHLIKVGENEYTIVDAKHVMKILKLSWHSMSNGYVGHSVSKTSNKLFNFNKSRIYLHEFVLKYCENRENIDNYNTIDHINRCTKDNRECNLRYANQTMQNLNQVRYRKEHDINELHKIGITHLPKHISYANSDNRFIIEDHPCYHKKNRHGTRTGNIIEKYYQILNIIIELNNNNTTCNENNSDNSVFHDVNTYMKSYYFKMYDIVDDDIYKTHKSIIEKYYNITENKNENDANTIVFKSDVLESDKSMILKKEDKPLNVVFIKSTSKRGCKFSYEDREKNHRFEMTSGSKLITLKDKFNKMKEVLEKYNEDPEMFMNEYKNKQKEKNMKT